jgi:YidC/Oxa1 family membrane protein insertase
MDIISAPLGILLGYIYSHVNSYGLALIIFTVIAKIVLLPFSIKQQKSMANMARIQPKLYELKKKYKNDQQTLSQETMRIYKEENVSMLGGCLPLLIQLPILLGLYQVINRPLTYVLRLSGEQIASVVQTLGLGFTESQIKAKELVIAQAMKVNAHLLPEFSKIGFIDFNFLGLNLSQTPSISTPSLLWIIPLLAALSSFFSTQLTAKATPGTGSSSGSAAQAASMSKSMRYMMPVMSLWITFTMPGGVGFYWLLTNLLMVVQQYALNKFIPVNQLPSNQKEKTKK